MNEMSKENKDLKTAQNKGSVLKRLVMCWNKFKEHHFWFCKHSRQYVANNGKYKNKDIRYWPRAWVRFICYSRHDILST